MTYEFHEVANIFPMMTQEEFDDLVKSIKENGQRDPIVIYENKIIDGRNRYKACEKLEIEPRVEQWDGNGSLLDFVRDKNLNRRQLSQSQRSMVAARMKPLYEDEARVRQKELAGTRPNTDLTTQGMEGVIKGETNEIVGKMLGISGATVKRASKVIKDGTPELQQAVDNGDVSVRKAAEISRLPKEVQNQALEETKVPKRQTKEEREAVARANEEYLASRPKVELTDNDIAIQESINRITTVISNNIGGLQTQICEMKNISNVRFDLEIFTNAIRKYADDLQVTIELKLRMEREGK